MWHNIYKGVLLKLGATTRCCPKKKDSPLHFGIVTDVRGVGNHTIQWSSYGQFTELPEALKYLKDYRYGGPTENNNGANHGPDNFYYQYWKDRNLILIRRKDV